MERVAKRRMPTRTGEKFLAQNVRGTICTNFGARGNAQIIWLRRRAEETAWGRTPKPDPTVLVPLRRPRCGGLRVQLGQLVDRLLSAGGDGEGSGFVGSHGSSWLNTSAYLGRIW